MKYTISLNTMEAQNKIKELTDKIYREGLEKANKDAEVIIHEAREKAELITNEAREKADFIIHEANKKALEITGRIQSEVRLSIRQVLISLKKEISEMIQVKVLKDPLQEAFQDTEFMKKIIEIVIRKWEPDKNETKLTVLLPKEYLEDTEKYFRQKAADILNKGHILKSRDGIERGFEIHPQNGHYKISMTDEAFEAYLREHFKPRTMDFLFGGEK